MIVHYFHFYKQWFYWIDDKEKGTYSKQMFDGDWEKYYTKFAEDITHRVAKEKLLNMFPKYAFDRAKPYHSSPSDSGSRQYKAGHRRGNEVETIRKK